MWRFFTFRVDTQITNFGSFWSTRLNLKRLRTKALGNSKCRTFSVLHEKFLLWPHHTLTHTHTLYSFFFVFRVGEVSSTGPKRRNHRHTTLCRPHIKDWKFSCLTVEGATAPSWPPGVGFFQYGRSVTSTSKSPIRSELNAVYTVSPIFHCNRIF